MKKQTQITRKLEYLRGELRAERISYGELAELQSLAKHIDTNDVELLEAAGVPEHKEECEHSFADEDNEGIYGFSICRFCGHKEEN